MDRAVPLIASLIFGGLGAAICWFTIRALLRQRAKDLVASRAPGKVIEMRIDRSGSDDNYFYPLVEFMTASGQRVEFESSIRSTPAPYKVGDAVQVVYDAAAPSSAEIAGVESSPSVLLLVFFGVPFLLIGLGILIRCVILGLCGPVQ